MKILHFNYLHKSFFSFRCVVCLTLWLRLPLTLTARDVEDTHGVIHLGGEDRCVYTLLVRHERSQECRQLCEVFQVYCPNDGNAAKPILQQRTKISHCSNDRERPNVFKVGESCTYVFSLPVPKGNDKCHDICNTVSDMCDGDDTVKKLQDWINRLSGENERWKTTIAELHTRIDELQEEIETSKRNRRVPSISHLRSRVHTLEERDKERLRELNRYQTMNEEKQSIVDRLSKTVQDLTNQSTEFQKSVEICKYELNDTKEALRTKLQYSEALRIEMTEMSTRQHQSQNALERCSSQLEAMSSTVSELKRENYGLRQRVQTPKPTLPTTTASSIHRDCDDVSESGMNTIVPDDGGKPFEVYCDMETDFGGWTVIQRRQDGSVDFYRGWEDYKNGFGDLNGEFWLGNDKIHRLTNQGQRYELRVDLENFENESKFAKYDHFAIGDERSKYAVTIGSYSGNAGDSLRDDNGMQFTTKDNDNDRGTSHNCAVSCTGAWWYNICSLSNLNGQYLHGKDSEWNVGIVWFHWLGMSYSLKRTEIKIRPVFKGESGFSAMYERK